MGRGGLLFRFTCSAELWGGRGTADKCHWRVWGALAVFQPHWVCPHSQHMCFPHLHCSGSRLLYRELALCCVVGGAVSGAEFAPFPSPLPPASSGGWASPKPASSSLELLSPSFVLRTGQRCLWLGLFAGEFSLSLLLSHSLSCYLMLTPSDCPQGIQAPSLP